MFNILTISTIHTAVVVCVEVSSREHTMSSLLAFCIAERGIRSDDMRFNCYFAPMNWKCLIFSDFHTWGDYFKVARGLLCEIYIHVCVYF